jgi:hypothetical protein
MDEDQFTSSRSDWSGRSPEQFAVSMSKGHPVGRVLVGAVVGLIVGAIVANIPDYHLPSRRATQLA